MIYFASGKPWMSLFQLQNKLIIGFEQKYGNPPLCLSTFTSIPKCDINFHFAGVNYLSGEKSTGTCPPSRDWCISCLDSLLEISPASARPAMCNASRNCDALSKDDEFNRETKETCSTYDNCIVTCKNNLGNQEYDFFTLNRWEVRIFGRHIIKCKFCNILYVHCWIYFWDAVSTQNTKKWIIDGLLFSLNN